MGPRRPYAAVVLLAVGLAATGCEPGVTEPSADLAGTWELSYTTRAARVCGPPVPDAGFRASCFGGGRLTLIQTGPQISGGMPFVGSCQSCGSVFDAFGTGTLPVTGRLEGTRLTLSTVVCRLSATVRGADAREVNGDAVCDYDGDRTEGTWRMSRTE